MLAKCKTGAKSSIMLATHKTGAKSSRMLAASNKMLT